MRRLTSCVALLLLLLAPTLSFADGKKKEEEPRNFGVQLSLGAPNGLGLSGVVRPFHWIHINAGMTYNTMAPGFFTGITLDPMRSVVGFTFTGELGGSFKGKIPGVSNAPEVSYVYGNLYPGIEFGNPKYWRFFVRAGLSYIDGTLYNFSAWTNNKDSSLTFSNPSFHGIILPTGQIGFLCYL